MAEALSAPALGAEDGVASYFEVHVRRGDRWMIDCTTPSAADAVAEAEDIARRADVLAVKVVNERYNPRTGQSAARVVFTLEKPERKRQQGQLRPMVAPRSATRAPAAPAFTAVPPGDAPDVAPGAVADGPSAARALPGMRPMAPSRPTPWLLFAWASLALALAAALLFVFLLTVT